MFDHASCFDHSTVRDRVVGSSRVMIACVDLPKISGGDFPRKSRFYFVDRGQRSRRDGWEFMDPIDALERRERDTDKTWSLDRARFHVASSVGSDLIDRSRQNSVGWIVAASSSEYVIFFWNGDVTTRISVSCSMKDNALMKMVSLKIYNGVAWLVRIESTAYVIFFLLANGKQPSFLRFYFSSLLKQ